jgi:four helix bundle protein
MKYDLEDLEVYKKAREFRKIIYRLAKEIPAEEKFSLISQMRRAAISLTNNIAEGHGR